MYGLDYSNHHPKEHGTGRGHHFGHHDHGRISHEPLTPPPAPPHSDTYVNPTGYTTPPPPDSLA